MEARFKTGFRGAETTSPGLVLSDDGKVRVVLPDMTRSELFLPADEKNPVVLSATFAGASADSDASAIPFVMPYDGHVEGASYIPVTEILFGSSDARTWQLVRNSDDTVVATGTFDSAVAPEGLPAGEAAPLVPDMSVMLQKGDVLRFESIAVDGDGPADPGGILAVAFIDPPAVTLPPTETIVDNIPPPGGTGGPIFQSFSPASQVWGGAVTLTGQYFNGKLNQFTNVYAVSFDGPAGPGTLPAQFRRLDDGHISVTVPDGAGTGRIRLHSTQLSTMQEVVTLSPRDFIALVGTPDPGNWAVGLQALGVATIRTPNPATVIGGGILLASSALLFQPKLRERIYYYGRKITERNTDLITIQPGFNGRVTNPLPTADPMPVSPKFGRAVPAGMPWTYEGRLTFVKDGIAYAKTAKMTIALPRAVTVEDEWTKTPLALWLVNPPSDGPDAFDDGNNFVGTVVNLGLLDGSTLIRGLITVRLKFAGSFLGDPVVIPVGPAGDYLFGYTIFRQVSRLKSPGNPWEVQASGEIFTTRGKVVLPLIGAVGPVGLNYIPIPGGATVVV